MASICVYANLWVGKQVYTTLAHNALFKSVSPYLEETHMSVSEDSSTNYVRDGIWNVSDFCVAELLKGGAMEWFEKSPVAISNKEEQRKAM